MGPRRPRSRAKAMLQPANRIRGLPGSSSYPLFFCGVVSAEMARVIRVVDGDTLVVDIAGREERVRLIGVDTTER